ncbi:unnamed protein product [Fusarium graminearum]|uniref:Uncharacterized protein n=1 Tax=Gibberella zeae TaxID=5518 RepID=A0A9N8RJW9_GIBZA|nr:unnamed protein product [Fusarium graminearum]CAF3560786.1 unnamed protein product [Fusarium graminearum]CAG1959343.1 unnamed protein product [Fusarium graminearum]CAG1997987.1 unnamed protein product [Fusarium graminearum]
MGNIILQARCFDLPYHFGNPSGFCVEKPQLEFMRILDLCRNNTSIVLFLTATQSTFTAILCIVWVGLEEFHFDPLSLRCAHRYKLSTGIGEHLKELGIVPLRGVQDRMRILTSRIWGNK